MNLLKFTRELKSFDTELKWAAVIMLGMAVWFFGERILGFHREHLHALDDCRRLLMVFFAVCYLACLHEKRKKHKASRMHYFDGLVSCLSLTVLVLVALAPVSYFLLTVVSPDLLFNLIQYEIANTHFTFSEVLERNTIASYNLEQFARFIFWGLGLSILLPVFAVRLFARPATLFSGNLS